MEVLIAMVVFAIVSVGVYGFLNESLYTYNYAVKKLSLTLASTKFIYVYWDNPPSDTDGWVYPQQGDIESYRITKTPLYFHNIVKVNWSFKNKEAEIAYEIYY